MGYRQEYWRSLGDPEDFWRDQARAVSWIRKPKRILDSTAAPLYRWYPDATLNTCYNALDRHVIAGRADEPALIFHSAITGERRTYSYARLLDEVARFGGALRELGVGAGDRVVIYLPMVPEAAIAMLACARIGAVHSVVFGGFAPAELSARIDDARPKVIVSASCGLEAGRVIAYKPMLDAALDRSRHQPDHCVILQRPQLRADLVEGRDLDWSMIMKPGLFEPASCVEVAATDPLYILYTSGTTGTPKGIVRDHGGHAVALTYSMRTVYDVGEGDVMFTASDVGWVVGHSYIVYGPLLAGATTVLYEGKPVGTPDAGAFAAVVAEHRVTVMFTAPTALRAIRKVDPDGPADGRSRPVVAAAAVPRRRAAGSRHVRLGEREAGCPGHRPLVADRDRLADRGQPPRPGTDDDQAGFGHGPGSGLRRPDPGRARRSGGGGCGGGDRDRVCPCRRGR